MSDPAESQARAFADAILAPPPAGGEIAKRQADRAAVDGLGRQLQREAAAQAALLKDPIDALAHRADDGGEVAVALHSLRSQIDALDPGAARLDDSPLQKLLRKVFPWIKAPLQRYFARFQGAQDVIATAARSLQSGRDQLRRDNITLGDDLQRLRSLSEQLAAAVEVAKGVEARLAAALERDIGPDDPRHAFVRDELLFAARQRVIDLQQQLAVSQQGVMAIDLIIKNNAELIRGVERALSVTMSAMKVAVAAALALAQQRLVLDKVQDVARAATQAATSAASDAGRASASLDELRAAFREAQAAMAQVAETRQRAAVTTAASLRPEAASPLG